MADAERLARLQSRANRGRSPRAGEQLESELEENLRAKGERQLAEGLYAEAVQTLNAALNLSPEDEDLPPLIAVAMQRAQIMGSATFTAPDALVGEVQRFLTETGIGAGGADGNQRHFDPEPMIQFALEEGLADASAEEIYGAFVERQMEGAIDTFDVVQSHLGGGVPLKVTLRVRAEVLELFSREPPHSGVLQTIPYDAVSYWKKLVDGIEMEFRRQSILEKAKKVKLVCPQAAACYQSIQNKLHERRQELGGAATRTQFFTVLWDRIDEAVEHVADGFKNLRQLSRFVEKRVDAERKLAASVMEMCTGSTGWGAGRSVDLLDILSESGKVNEAWAALVEKTKETAHAHQEMADNLQAEVLNEGKAFIEIHESNFKRSEREAKAYQKDLKDAESAADKSKLQYFRSEMEFEQVDVLLRAAAQNGKAPGKKLMEKRDAARSKRDEAQQMYESVRRNFNREELRLIW